MPSLWCLISALRQAGGGGLLFRFACSVALRGGRGAADRYHCVGSTHVFWPHWVCPAHVCVCSPRLHCSGSRLLCMERALCCVRFQFSDTPQKRGLGWASVLCLPRPKQLRQLEAWAHSPQCGAPFPSVAPACAAGRVPEACVCLEELASSRDPPVGGISGIL